MRPPKVDHVQNEAAEAEPADDTGLPEGFFDDPDVDAKMRGKEAPSKRAERELEEGFRRFEREMQAEQEKAEEARHEIDEQKYEAAAAEESEFQVQLQSRLELLRQKTANLKRPKPLGRGVFLLHLAGPKKCKWIKKKSRETMMTMKTWMRGYRLTGEPKASTEKGRRLQ